MKEGCCRKVTDKISGFLMKAFLGYQDWDAVAGRAGNRVTEQGRILSSLSSLEGMTR